MSNIGQIAVIIAGLVASVNCDISFRPVFDPLKKKIEIVPSYNITVENIFNQDNIDPAISAVIKAEEIAGQQKIAGQKASAKAKSEIAEEAAMYAQRASRVLPSKEEVVHLIEERIDRNEQFKEMLEKRMDDRSFWIKHMREVEFHNDELIRSLQELIERTKRLMKDVALGEDLLERLKCHLKYVCRLKHNIAGRLERAKKSLKEFKMITAKIALLAASLAIDVEEDRTPTDCSV